MTPPTRREVIEFLAALTDEELDELVDELFPNPTTSKEIDQ